MLVRPDRLGDVVITTTCLEPVRQQLPECTLILALKKPFGFIVKDNANVDQCFTFQDNFEVSSLTAELRERELDAIVFLNPHPAFEAAAEAAGIPLRVGYSRGNGERLNAWLPYQWKKAGQHHEAYYNFDLLELFGIRPPEELKPYIKISPEIIKNARQRLGQGPPVALIHLASHGKKPRVPAPFYADIVKRLLKETDVRIAVVGENREDPSVKEFMQCMGEQARLIIDFAGQTSVEELGGLAATAQLMISRDSGPAHLAAAVGCPTLAFFINPRPLMSPRRWAPIGHAVRIYTKPIFSLPFETPHRLAKRTVRLFRTEEAYQEALSLIKVYSPNRSLLR